MTDDPLTPKKTGPPAADSAATKDASRAHPLPFPRARLWLLALALAAIFFMAVKAYHSFDVWHHIRSGWYAWHHGPADTEPFSCTGQVLKLHWLQYEWIAQVVIYAAHVNLGVAGTILAKAALYMLAFVLLARACREGGSGLEATIVALLAAALAASQRFYVRPEVFSVVLFGVVLWAVERARNGRFGLAWGLPALFALWANLHGAYVAGWVILGIHVGSWEVERRLGRRDAPDRRAVLRLGAILALCVAAVLLNPYGVNILKVPFQLSRSTVVTEHINEWKPYPLHLWLRLCNVFVLVVLIACVIGWRRIRVSDALLVLAFGVMAYSARRHVSLAAFVTAPIVARMLSPLFQALVRKRGRLWATDGVLAALCVGSVFAAHDLRLSTLRLSIDPSKYPEMASDYLRYAGIRGNLFNDYSDGNYFLWWNYPEDRVFIDGRIDMYGDEVMRYWREVKLAARPGAIIKEPGGNYKCEGWRSVLKRFDVTSCVVRFKVEGPEDEPAPPVVGRDKSGRPPSDPFINALWKDPDWKLVFWDDIIVVFLRSDQVGDRYVYRTRPDTFDATRIPDVQTWQTAAEDLEQRVAMGLRFDCATVRVSAANVYQARGMFDKALPHLQRALELQPWDAKHAYNLGACLLSLRHDEEAAKCFRQALDLGSQEPEKTWNGLGACYLDLGQYAEAVPCLRKAIDINPKYVYAYLSLSQAYQGLGDLRSAVAAAQEALRIAPNSPAAQDRWRKLQQQTRSSP